ncbi:MAG: DNA-binding MurR/RpiR family transcriptional regulator [Planctomycetota bacterium]|jgi:DNA-binding MurR/RpiR family transcriptional regulator
MTIPNLIANAGERLTPTEHRIAELVLQEPTLLAFGTVSDLAERVGTSRPSIVRFATKLGFEGYTDLQGHVRRELTQQLSRPGDRIRHSESAIGPARLAMESALSSVFEALGEGRIERLAQPIAEANNVWILTGETSRSGAHVLQSGLSMVRSNVRLIEEHSSGRDLSSATPGDVAVVFDFARYRRHSVSVAQTLADQGVHIVAITDGPLSPLAMLTEDWCALRVPGIGPFDSSVPAVAVAELLVAHVAHQLHDEAQERIDRTEALWEATGTFLESKGGVTPR